MKLNLKSLFGVIAAFSPSSPHPLRSLFDAAPRLTVLLESPRTPSPLPAPPLSPPLRQRSRNEQNGGKQLAATSYSFRAFCSNLSFWKQKKITGHCLKEKTLSRSCLIWVEKGSRYALSRRPTLRPFIPPNSPRFHRWPRPFFPPPLLRVTRGGARCQDS